VNFSIRRLATLFPLLLIASVPGSAFAAQSVDGLSGKYRLHFEQTSKSCGEKLPPVEVDVTFVFSATQVNLKFPSGFLGFNLLDLKYDPESGEFNDRLQQTVNLGSVQADLSLQVEGRVKGKDKNPEVVYEITFDKKVAEDPDWNCRVTGKGTARKL
jgi:hypothetical protein